MKLSKNLKIVIVAVVLVVIVIVASVAAAGIVALDVWSTFSSGSEKLTPDGAATGKALVVYDAGVSGLAKDVAAKIANDLKSQGYEVTLAGVKNAATASVTGYDVIVAGGPVYSGKVGSSVYEYLDDLQAPGNAKVGAFAVGNYKSEDKAEKVFPDATTLDAYLMLFPEDDVDKGCAGFVSDLLQ